MTPTHLSLFSGIGGLDLAAEAAGFKTVGQCEWADYPTKVLEKHWPDVPRWRDIHDLTANEFIHRTGIKTVDVISGGFPCQPFSVAGKQRGKEDDRYLWPEMLRAIKELRPAWVLGENVPGIINLALDTVLSDLEAAGYAVQTFNIPAAGVDALHKRARIAIVAYCDSNHRRAWRPEPKRSQRETRASNGRNDVADAGGAGLQGREQYGASDAGEREPEPSGSACECGQDVADSDEYGRSESGHESAIRRDTDEIRAFESEGCNVPYAARSERKRNERSAEPAGSCGFANDGWWPAEPDVGRVAHGIPARVDRLKCLGNAVVPQQFFPFFHAMYEVSYRKEP